MPAPSPSIPLDRPEILACLFHPRPGYRPNAQANGDALRIPVGDGAALDGRCHRADPAAVTLLYFHGNGEIVDDHDDLGPVYARRGLNFLVVDYRGYGQSTGQPTASTLLADSHAVLGFVTHWLKRQDFTGPLVVMGRSLGSAPALELASHHPEVVAGLILESGFAHTGPLLRRLGVNLAALNFEEHQGFRQLDKVRIVAKPTLIIHAEHDHIIPFGDGQALYDASPARDKRLLRIPGADHNTIFAVGWRAYLEAVETFAASLRSGAA
ncbi:MAG: alpha/beta hydrolase [Candidatus Contendobacter sp.]|nr:alpha/beta hydrolase [Candidatus Contendobacter sp.]MDG4557368.1 alpha/beta hydrolase [Candidatus Contendobacter sp.]